MPASEINLPCPSDELEDNFAGATERLLTIHFGIPDPPLANYPEDDVFRWEQPLGPEDAVQGFIGGPDGFWHPKRLKQTSYRGTTSPAFIRLGRKPPPRDI